MFKFVLSLLGMLFICVGFLILALYVSHLPIVYHSWSTQQCVYIEDQGVIKSCTNLNSKYFVKFIY